MLILALIALAAAPHQSKTTAADDWQPLTIVAVGQTSSGPDYLDVHAGDLDGDGLPDDAYVKLVCADGKLQQAFYEVKPRDTGSGMPTGKRMHKPMTVVKEWGAASPQLMKLRPTYDVKSATKARVAGAEEWNALSLSSGDETCSALAAERATIVKSKSNITNN